MNRILNIATTGVYQPVNLPGGGPARIQRLWLQVRAAQVAMTYRYINDRTTVFTVKAGTVREIEGLIGDYELEVLAAEGNVIELEMQGLGRPAGL